MMKRTILAAPLLLLPAASSLPIQPGMWQTTVTIIDVEMPDAPPMIAAMMKGKPHTVNACVTAEQAANGPSSVVQASNGRCHYTNYSAIGGRFSAVMECGVGRGVTTISSSGTYTATSLDLTGATTGDGGMRMKTHTVGRRTGGC